MKDLKIPSDKKQIETISGKKVRFDDYDMNENPLFVDSSGAEYWVEGKDVWTNDCRGGSKKLKPSSKMKKLTSGEKKKSSQKKSKLPEKRGPGRPRKEGPVSSRECCFIDEETKTIMTNLGKGNFSEGIREAARMIKGSTFSN